MFGYNKNYNYWNNKVTIASTSILTRGDFCYFLDYEYSNRKLIIKAQTVYIKPLTSMAIMRHN